MNSEADQRGAEQRARWAAQGYVVPERKRRVWPWVVGVLALIFVLFTGCAVVVGAVLGDSGDEGPEPVAEPVAEPVEEVDEVEEAEEVEEVPEPVAIPDVVGMPGDEARDLIRDADLQADLEGDEGAVFSPGNWIVESTDPEAGTEIETGETVTLYLTRPEEEAAEEEPEETPEPEPTEAAEPDEDLFEISQLDLGEIIDTTVEWDIPTGLTRGTMATRAELDTLRAIEAAVEEYPEYDRITVIAWVETMDDFGNEGRAMGVVASYNRETVERINFDSPGAVNAWSIRDAGGGCRPVLCD